MAARHEEEALPLEAWLKEVAPSPALRQWFGHDLANWEEFQLRYRAELDRQPETWQGLWAAARQGAVTLLYSARDTEHNSAVVLQAYLRQRLPGRARA